MLTRREKLLVRPWQQRRYNHHRRKVQSALPAIDVGPPITHNHISVKLKKLQQEEERTAKIEEQNLKLLRQLGTIMCKNRLDNHWIVEPPNFLHRVTIYKPCKQTICVSEALPDVLPEKLMSRKQRCLACSPQNIQQIKIIPEERVPWELPRPSVRRPKIVPIDTVMGRTTSSSENHRDKQQESSTRQLTLTSGNLQLAVKFPAHSSVKLQNGSREKLLTSEYCECNALLTTKKP